MGMQESLYNNPKIVVTAKSIMDGYESISSKLRKKKGRGSTVSDIPNKAYITLQPRGSGDSKHGWKPSVAIYLGKNICDKARFIKGDYIEVLYNSGFNTWLLRRTNDLNLGYKLCPSGGKENTNSFVVKMIYDKDILPLVKDGASIFEKIVISDKGIFLSSI
jgi:hypothetical protein